MYIQVSILVSKVLGLGLEPWESGLGPNLGGRSGLGLVGSGLVNIPDPHQLYS
jgi:hypothetical protein